MKTEEYPTSETFRSPLVTTPQIMDFVQFLYENKSIITTGVKLRIEIQKSMCNTYMRNTNLWKYKKCNGTNNYDSVL